jgi:hypothetical protein
VPHTFCYDETKKSKANKDGILYSSTVNLDIWLGLMHAGTVVVIGFMENVLGLLSFNKTCPDATFHICGYLFFNKKK